MQILGNGLRKVISIRVQYNSSIFCTFAKNIDLKKQTPLI